MRGVAAVALAFALGCGGASRPASPTTPPSKGGAIPTEEATCAGQGVVAGHTQSIDRKTTVIQQSVCCPTDVEEARLAYDGALDSEEARDYATAMDGYRRAIELDPSFCDAMDNLGLIHRGLGQLDEAIALYRRSLAIVPRNPVALQNIAVALIHAGRLEEALPYYEKLVAADPDNPEGPYGLGQMYMKVGRTGDAIREFEKAHALYKQMGSPLIAHTHFLLGMLYLDKQDVPKARAHLQAALDLGMEDARDPLSSLPPP